jgi:hypothetical protein
VLTLGIALMRAGNRAAAQSKYDELTRLPRSDALLAQWHAALGEYDEAFRLARNSRGSLVPLLRVDPLYAGIRGDRRFSELAGS